MATIKAPVKGYTGRVVGVAFSDGVGETEDAAALAYFRRHGYTVEDTEKTAEVPEGAPSGEWKVDQLKAYAEQHEIDLGKASKKDEIVAAIEAAAKQSEGSTPAE